MVGLYVHVPFCAKKCPYCDFYSEGYSKARSVAYTEAVLRNLEYYSSPDVVADTLYFGGGTPSLLGEGLVGSVVEVAKRAFHMPPDSEVTLEANPRTLNPKRLEAFRAAGVNRLSVGVQSCVDGELRVLGRNHTFADCERVVRVARACGFENVSCDLMVGTPTQTMDSLRYSCETLSRMGIQHISSYLLKVEDGTPYGRDAALLASLPDDDTVSDMYLESVRVFESYGYAQYEVSNFAKAGFESRHNLKYWQCVDYLGIGSGAHSCYGGVRFCVPKSIDSFVQSEHQPVDVTEEHPYTFEEVGMLSLRLKSGLDLSRYPQRLEGVLRKAVPLERMGYLTIDGSTVSLTPKGFLVSNSIIESLVL